MEIAELIPHIEALIFASEKPLPTLEVADLLNNAFGFMEDKVTLDQVETAVDGIKEKYVSEFYPFEVVQSGGGWQFLTKKEYHKTIAQLNGDKFMKRLSAAALETLAIVAYKQPVTKGEIEAIRGVSADYAIQKLLEKELVVISGRNEKLPGHPLVYATSKSFMDYFGINSSDELPKIKEVLAEQMVAPNAIVNGETVLENEEVMDGDGNPLAVSENGELIENAATNQDAEMTEDAAIEETEIKAEAASSEEDTLLDDDDDEIEIRQGDDEAPFDDDKKQETQETFGNEAEDESQDDDEEEKKEEDDEPAD